MCAQAGRECDAQRREAPFRHVTQADRVGKAEKGLIRAFHRTTGYTVPLGISAGQGGAAFRLPRVTQPSCAPSISPTFVAKVSMAKGLVITAMSGPRKSLAEKLSA